MTAVDTNVLVYAAISGSQHHQSAYQRLGALAEGSQPWAIPWPCIYEFLRVVTHPKVFHPPLTPQAALGQIKQLLASPTLVLLSETTHHLDVLEMVISQSGATGNLMHDTHVAALCLEHGVSELLTGDRDFHRFTGFKVTNPFGA